MSVNADYHSVLTFRYDTLFLNTSNSSFSTSLDQSPIIYCSAIILFPTPNTIHSHHFILPSLVIILESVATRTTQNIHPMNNMRIRALNVTSSIKIHSLKCCCTQKTQLSFSLCLFIISCYSRSSIAHAHNFA